MEFNSITFFIFLITIFLVYRVIKKRMLWLLIVSLGFYLTWSIPYIFLVIISAITDYIVAIKMSDSESKKIRRFMLSLSLLINLGLLIYFKYWIFITENVMNICDYIGISYNWSFANIILPFGISFYTFETISYSVDVYRGEIKPERNIVKYGVFVAFFPKLIAGPIQRAGDLLPQLSNNYNVSRSKIKLGLTRILEGMFLKVVLADQISIVVDDIFNVGFMHLGWLDMTTAGVLFGLQIYFDFAAYSSIAIGLAALFGIAIPENFNYPYSSKTFKEFWRRWHISLSSWIRDYLYLPLYGKLSNSGGKLRGLNDGLFRNAALVITWVIMGFWHGANWNFALWGLLHALFILIERIFIKKIKMNNIMIILWQFFVLSCIAFSWVIFRINNLTDLSEVLKNLSSFKYFFSMNLRENYYLIAFLLTISLMIRQYVIARQYLKGSFYRVSMHIIMLVLTFIFFGTKSQFIYFQF